MMKIVGWLGLSWTLVFVACSSNSAPGHDEPDANGLADGGDGQASDQGSEADDMSGADESQPPHLYLFKSSRTEQELLAGQKVKPGLKLSLALMGLYGSDFLMLKGLLDRVGARGTKVTAVEKAKVQLILDNFAQVRDYIGKVVAGAKNLETVSTAIAASRLMALAENQGLVQLAHPARAPAPVAEQWTAFIEALTTGAAVDVLVPQLLKGPDCGEAPPADGSLPPDGTESSGSAFVSAVTQSLSATKFAIQAQDREHVPYVREYLNRLKWYQMRRSPNAPAYDVDVLSQRYLDRVYAVLSEVIKAPAYDPYQPLQGQIRGGAGPLSIAAEEQAMLMALNHRLRYGAQLNENLAEIVPVPAQIAEDPFHLVDNQINSLDGRDWPIFVSNGVTVGSSQGTSWIVVYYDQAALLAADFNLERTAWEIDHIDYRFRRPNDETVLRWFVHTPSEGKIALGQNIDLSSVQPQAASHETFLVHALATDRANHPSEGSCSYINIHWMPSPAPGTENDPVELGLLGVLDPTPPLMDDGICRSWDYGHMSRLDMPERNVFLRLGASGLWIEPDTLMIINAGESLYIQNKDQAAHRFMTTATSHFGILGSVGGEDRNLDTGMIAPMGQKLITLPTGLPATYWFNLVEVTQKDDGSIQEILTSGPRIYILVQNLDCLVD